MEAVKDAAHLYEVERRAGTREAQLLDHELPIGPALLRSAHH
jgi:hypothetical protein